MVARTPTGPRVAIVTGAAGGMGRVIAARLADDGCLVAALDVRDTDAAARLRAGRATTFLTADVSSRASLEEALGRVEADLGPPSVLVNAAAVLTRAPFLELADADWERVLSINLRGTFLACQTVARAMVRGRAPGRIVNISSNSQVMATPLAAHYAASKGGVAALTRTMALELAPHGITANLVCPGPGLTDMNRAAFSDPACRAFITGAALFVDGGQTLTVAI